MGVTLVCGEMLGCRDVCLRSGAITSPELKVADLLDPYGHTWQGEVLQQLFSDDIRQKRVITR